MDWIPPLFVVALFGCGLSTSATHHGLVWCISTPIIGALSKSGLTTIAIWRGLERIWTDYQRCLPRRVVCRSNSVVGRHHIRSKSRDPNGWCGSSKRSWSSCEQNVKPRLWCLPEYGLATIEVWLQPRWQRRGSWRKQRKCFTERWSMITPRFLKSYWSTNWWRHSFKIQWLNCN